MMQTVWGWQPALYLFLGGMGGGCFLTAAILYLKDAAHNKRTVCASMWAATISLAIGLLLLLAELITPARGLMMWQSFSHFTSWMTFGAWGAFAAIVVFGLSAIFATEKVKVPASVRRALAIIGIVLGAFVAVYTGMLLMAPASVPFWNTPLLPLLFTVSAFDTGVALVEVMAVVAARKDPLAADAKRFLERCVVVLVVVEMVALAAFLGTALAGGSDAAAATASASAAMLVEGPLAGWFWALLVAVGLALPLVVAIAGLAKGGQHGASGATSLTVADTAAAPAPSDATAGSKADAAIAPSSQLPDQGSAGVDDAAPVDAVADADPAQARVQAWAHDDGGTTDATVAGSDSATKATRVSRWFPLVGACGALAGGCALRFLVLAAGVHANLVASTIMALIG